MALDSTQRRYLNWLLDPRPERPKDGDPDSDAYKRPRRELARALRSSLGAFDRYEHDPEFVAEWEKTIAEVSGGPQRLQKLLDGLYLVASGQVDGTRPADIIAATRLHLEVTGRHEPKQRITIDDPRLVRATDEELSRKATERNKRLVALGKQVDEVFEGSDGVG